MRIARFISQDNAIQYGWIDEDLIGIIQGNPFGEYRRFEAKQKLSEVKLLAPCEPTKIIVVAHNFPYKFEDVQTPPPDYPIFSFKPSSSLIASGEPILLPPQSQRVEHEAELAVVIAKRARWLRQEEVNDVIFGYTIANDITARDLEISDGHSSRAKGFDTFCPIGPWIETEFDSSDAIISCNVNSTMRQMASTRDMHFTIDRLLMFISSVMTLNPGDLILTGSPNGTSILETGDIVTVNIEGIGNLVNPVQSAIP